MRPLKRLPNGKNYRTYQSYRSDLLSMYGPFCAYCEKKDHDLDIEHVEPKSKSGKITDWHNLLLACPSCNRDYKKAVNADRKGYVFPDHNETFKVFHYHSNGSLKTVSAAAAATRKLCGLGRAATISDRADVYTRAIEAKREMIAGTRRPEQIIGWAAFMGHWSVWMAVYHDMPDMLALLRDHAYFPGTRAVFQNPVNRPKVRI